MDQRYEYSQWLPFKEIYTLDKNAKSRESKFRVENDIVTKPVAGIYLIADSLVGSLDSPESLIYIGKTVGTTKLSSFHERLWKYCCLAIGECGGRYSFKNGDLQRDGTDRTEPRDTKKWANYRHNQFKDFSTWYFSFYRLDESNFDIAKEKIARMKDITMYAYSYYSTLQKPLCSGSSPQLTVKFPWKHL